MIARLKGILDGSGDGQAVIDVNGVGYLIFCSGRTLSALGNVGEAVKVEVETHVREDHIHLYGFSSGSEKASFRMLQTVQGVGAKHALSILTVLSPDELFTAIAAQDRTLLTRADGVGPKLATRIVNELKDKTVNVALGIAADAPAAARNAAVKAAGGDTLNDAVSALVNLGYGRAEAYGAVQVAQAALGADAALDRLITGGLKELAG
ncbi:MULTISPECIES: Holliday junction branch migration protein RuvA [Thalassobaculum]|uniref:Holliday junction branch migration complex subunit RuvA n=1 Tax=Thalassobaculum litoreum DSM 18839 TaxID=1123362 RepID=A0A8G2EVC9_9PROT|nr:MULTISPECIES: Holliday junction branch migration protein RuvA [Thalassobaculum]SDF24320.1 Holliday junction DNA helicase subunit RuvA [Thalassobaculum litoreum DSM 18839]